MACSANKHDLRPHSWEEFLLVPCLRPSFAQRRRLLKGDSVSRPMNLVYHPSPLGVVTAALQPGSLSKPRPNQERRLCSGSIMVFEASSRSSSSPLRDLLVNSRITKVILALIVMVLFSLDRC